MKEGVLKGDRLVCDVDGRARRALTDPALGHQKDLNSRRTVVVLINVRVNISGPDDAPGTSKTEPTGATAGQ